MYEALKAIEKIQPPEAVCDSDLQSLQQAAATEATRAGIDWIPQDTWSTDNNDAEIIRQFQNGLAHTDLPSLLNSHLARLEFGDLQVRSLTGHVMPIEQGGYLWKVLSGDAELIPIASGQALRYRFANSSSAPIVLQSTFDAGIPADQLHRLVISYKGDGSWNHMDVDLQL